jgi:hypothetical protein
MVGLDSLVSHLGTRRVLKAGIITGILLVWALVIPTADRM